MDYTLDTNAAKQADQFFSRIEQAGKYFGTFTRAEKVTSKKGTTGIDFSFKADTGETADYLTVWTHNASGEELMGFRLLMAIMTCLRVKGISAAPAEIEKYDFDTKQREKKTVDLFKDLMGKPIGLLIHMEEYEKKDLSTAWKAAISAPFDKDEFTASEILNKAQKPETLAKMVQGLRDKPLKKAAAKPSMQSAAEPGSFDDIGDDIPW